MTYRSIADLDKWLFSHLKDNEEISDDIGKSFYLFLIFNFLLNDCYV